MTKIQLIKLKVFYLNEYKKYLESKKIEKTIPHKRLVLTRKFRT